MRGIDADMRLHPEMPLVGLLARRHLRVPLAQLVLRRRWGGDQGGIHDRAFAQDQAALSQQRDNLLEQALGQLVRFQKMTKVQDRRFVRQPAGARVQACEPSQHGDVVQRFLHPGV